MIVLKVITPAAAVVTYDEAKAHLRLDSDDERALVEQLVATATASLDGPDGWLGRALGAQTLELSLDRFEGDALDLPLPPVASVESLTYDATDGAEVTLAPSLYRLAGGSSAARLVLTSGSRWPQIRAGVEAVRVRYQAGYPNGIPTPIKQAILLTVGLLFQNREDTEAPSPELTAAGNLLAPFRVY